MCFGVKRGVCGERRRKEGGWGHCGYVNLCVHIHQNKEFDDFGLPLLLVNKTRLT